MKPGEICTLFSSTNHDVYCLNLFHSKNLELTLYKVLYSTIILNLLKNVDLHLQDD